MSSDLLVTKNTGSIYTNYVATQWARQVLMAAGGRSQALHQTFSNWTVIFMMGSKMGAKLEANAATNYTTEAPALAELATTKIKQQIVLSKHDLPVITWAMSTHLQWYLQQPQREIGSCQSRHQWNGVMCHKSKESSKLHQTLQIFLKNPWEWLLFLSVMIYDWFSRFLQFSIVVGIVGISTLLSTEEVVVRRVHVS